MDVTLAGLRVLRETAERGTFTAAAAALGYTQSAVSRQIAALERATGTRLFDRRPDGPVLTAAGRTLLRHGRAALDEIDLAARALRDEPTGGRLRLGVFPSAGAVLLPRTLAAMRRSRPDLLVVTRVGTTPSLVRGLRAGTLDVAVLASRPPHRPFDGESPPLELHPLVCSTLLVAVPAGGPLGDRDGVTVAELAGEPWIVTPSSTDEPQLGTWPGMPGRARVVHSASDWATKLHLVAAGCGVTTVSRLMTPALPPGVRALPVVDGPDEQRRIVAARLPDRPLDAAARDVVDALAAEAADLVG